MTTKGTAYTKEQQAIIAHREGPAYVVAGAGTGKTFTMTARVQALIESGIRPENILVLTFTNAAANEMMNRVRANIGETAKKVTACTYHSFCNILMRRYGQPSYNYTILDSSDDSDLIQLVKVNSTFVDAGLPRSNMLRDIYSKHLNCRLSYEEILKENKYSKIQHMKREIEAFYPILQKYKQEHGLVNYDDMLIYCEAILRSPYGNEVRKQYQYVMVDEAQDTNDIQFSITQLLSNNIMYIGDPEQSIYGFRGSNLNLYLSVPSRTANTKIYTLSNNYRCTQQVLDVANSVIEKDKIPYKAILQTGKGYFGKKPKLYQPADQEEETDIILSLIKTIPENETAAVIYRNSALSALLERELVRNKIDYIKRGGIKFFEMACIRDMVALFRLMVNPHDNLAWFRTLQNNRLIGEKRANEIVGDGSDPLNNNPFRKKTNKTAIAICKQLDLLEQMFEAATGADFEEQRILSESYYFHLLERNIETLKTKKVQDKTIEAAESFYNNARIYVPILLELMKDFQSVKDFLDNMALDIRAVPENVAAIGQENEGEKSDKTANLVLTTVHSAKGLEWDHVYIMDAVQGIFPNENAKEKEVEEERRCMYVAVTRARGDLAIFCPESSSVFGRYHDGYLSEFLEPAIKQNLIDCVDGYPSFKSYPAGRYGQHVNINDYLSW